MTGGNRALDSINMSCTHCCNDFYDFSGLFLRSERVAGASNLF